MTTVSKQKKDETAVPKFKEVMSPLLKDIATMNMAFTFGLHGSARNVALWGHQSILAQLPSLSALISKLKDIEGDPSSPEAISGVKTTHVTEYSLEAYCALVRYLYTSEITIEVDLNDFAIGGPPNKPFSPSCKNRANIDGLFPSKDTVSPSAKLNKPVVTSRRTSTWSDLFQIADCYQVTELRKYCLDKILETLNASTALDVLFNYAYRYPDLKATALKYAADSMTELYSKGKDPLSAYADHPKRHELMSEVMYVVFRAKSQTQ
ncbi:hypothetical protein CPB97_001111 [Podila verticillata]|nr:hypothetical protein CPB97_001111 [Podila verticillata]